MKTLKIIITVLIMVIFAVGCKSTKDVTQSTKTTKINLPFDGKQYQTNKNYIRSVANGESTNIGTAEDIAVMNAISRISTSIKTVSKNVSLLYKNETGQDLDIMVVNVSKQILTNLVVVDKKVYKEVSKTNKIKYTYWVVMEINKNDIINSITDNNKQIKFDRYQFKKIFDKEMEEYQKSLN